MSLQIVDFSTTNSQVIDEIINVADSNPIRLEHDIFYNKTGKKVVVSTGAGGSGTVLTETTDWVAGSAVSDSLFPTSISPDVGYTTLAILNATYHDTDLYLSYYPIADTFNATRWNDAISQLGGEALGEYRMRQDAKSPSALFPQINLTSFSGVSTVNTTNWPLYTPYLRAIHLKIGATSTFAGTASASTITLTDTADNNALLAALAESVAHFGYNYTVDWDGVSYAITNISTLTRVITVTGTPTAGAGNATFYPHRIAGSSTTARVFSLQGLGLIGMGDADWYFVGGLARRGYMQGHWHTFIATGNAANNIFNFVTHGDTQNNTFTGGVGTSDGVKNPINDNLGNGTPRTAKTTNGPSWSVEIYQHGGRYIA